MANEITISPLSEWNLKKIEEKLTPSDPNSDEFSTINPRLHSVIPQKHDFEASLKRINLGEEVCLIAYSNSEPVGRLHLRWAGDYDIPRIVEKIPTAKKYLNIPSLFYFWVKYTFQNQGIGKKLVDYTEYLAKEKGYSMVGGTVDDINVNAKKLYLRLGFKESELKDFVTSGSYKKDGLECTFLHGPMSFWYKRI